MSRTKRTLHRISKKRHRPSRRNKTTEAKARKRALRVLKQVLNGKSLSAAVRAEHTSGSTALKYIGHRLRKAKGTNRYVPIKSRNRVPRLFIITPKGYVAVAVRSFRERSLLGQHAAAVGKFLRPGTGDASVLSKFEGKKVAGRKLITDPELLRTLADAGALRLDDLYAVPGGAR